MTTEQIRAYFARTKLEFGNVKQINLLKLYEQKVLAEKFIDEFGDVLCDEDTCYLCGRDYL